MVSAVFYMDLYLLIKFIYVYSISRVVKNPLLEYLNINAKYVSNVQNMYIEILFVKKTNDFKGIVYFLIKILTISLHIKHKYAFGFSIFICNTHTHGLFRKFFS